MDIEESLSKDHSKYQSSKVADFVGCDEGKFAELMELFMDYRMEVHQRAAMAVSICVDRYPFLLNRYLGPMLDNLKNPVHDSVIRTTVRALQDIEVPDQLYGEVWDVCYQYLVSPKYPVAIRVFSMMVLANISKKLPELKNELKILIEDQMPYGSAGFISRGKKVLAMLRKNELKHNKFF